MSLDPSLSIHTPPPTPASDPGSASPLADGSGIHEGRSYSSLSSVKGYFANLSPSVFGSSTPSSESPKREVEVSVNNISSSSSWSISRLFSSFRSSSTSPEPAALDFSNALQGKLFSLLLQTASSQPHELYAQLIDLFGERLVEETMASYDFNAISSIELQLHIFLGVVAASVKAEDVRDLHARFASHPGELAALQDLLPAEDFEHLAALGAKPFHELSSSDINAFLNIFRQEIQLDGSCKPRSLDPSLVKGFVELKPADHEVVQIGVAAKLLEAFGESALFQSSAFERYAEEEYFCRTLAYTSLKEGMLLPYWKMGASEPVCYEVKKVIDQEGFGFFLLKAVGGEGRAAYKALFRGTDFADIDSARGCLSHGVGLDHFLKNQVEVRQSILAYLVAEEEVSFSIAGHSQGGAISQLLLWDLMGQMAEMDAESPLQKIGHLSMVGWNPPAILESQAEDIKEYAAKLNESKPECRIDIHLCRVLKDVVHTFGEVYAGFAVDAPNVFVEYTEFEPTNSNILVFGPHRNYILTKERDPVGAVRCLKSNECSDAELQKALSDTSYKSLSSLDQVTGGLAVNALKVGLYNMTDSSVPIGKKVATGAAVAAGGSAALVGVGAITAVVISNPVTAGIAVVAGGAGYAAYKGAQLVTNNITRAFAGDASVAAQAANFT